MPLLDISIKNFRNIFHKQLPFAQKNTIFFGKNGQGKTNLLEAIFFILSFRSFKTKYLVDLINCDVKQSFLSGNLNIFESKHTVKITIQKEGKIIFFDEKKLNRLSLLYKSIFPMVFSSEAIFFFRNFPAQKRTFFNRCICFEDKEYLNETSIYNKLIKQKKNLLKQTNDSKNISAWNEIIAKKILYIVKKRYSFIDRLNHILGSEMKYILNGDLPAKIVYTPTVLVDYDSDPKQVEGRIIDFLLQKQAYEINRQQVMFGPHLDNYSLRSKNTQSEILLSDGQFKFFFYSLQFCLAKLLEESGQEVVFLMDDFSAELDNNLINFILTKLNQKQNQTFLTTTDQKNLNSLEDKQIIPVSFSSDKKNK